VFETLQLVVEGNLARLWLNRPNQLNALSALVLDEIVVACDQIQKTPDVQVVVLGGQGRSFCAGADRKNPPARPSKASGQGPRFRRYASQIGRRAAEALESLDAVTIARLHGHVIGGGVVLATACDLRIAAAGAQFHVPEVDLGIPLTWGGVPRLARLVGGARAREIILLCDRFDAATAERYGLVNRVVADDQLDAAVDDWALRLAAKPPWAVHMTKTQFRAYERRDFLGDLTEADGDLITVSTSEDPSRFAFGQKP
jgi:enoyl-CoA hydratase/carnithine racemase